MAQVEERRNVTGAQVALVLLVLLVILVGAWFFLLRGDTTEETAAPPAPAVTPVPTPEPTEDVRRPGRGRVETFEVFAPKDPFKPAVAQAVTGTGAPAPGATAAPGGGTTTDGTNGGFTAGGNGGNGRNESVGGHRIRLVDVFSENGRQRARVQVDGTVYTVDEGDRFADNFELLSIQGRCASLLFGDDQFTLCEGEEILK